METQNLKTRIKGSITIKILTILLMILLLMIPNFMIDGLIHERSSRKSDIEKEIGKSYGYHQKIMVPVLKVPYSKIELDNNDNEVIINGELSFAPNTTEIIGNIETDTRKRSIYEVVIFDAQLDLQSNFNVSKTEYDKKENWTNCTFNYDKAYFLLGISDPNGLSEKSKIKVGNHTLDLIENANINLTNMAWVKSSTFKLEEFEDLSIECDLHFKGTRSLMIEPLGEQVVLDLKSPWQDPSFVGSQLPKSYDISENGFDSQWSVNRFAHSYPTYWQHDQITFNNQNHSFGVKLIQPIDEYGKNKRTAKYALLIIALTFGIFFFFEILLKKNIHPVQYTLIGFSLTMFYLLLLSITEHLGFDFAYLISSIATIGLIVSYTKFIIQHMKGTALLSGLLIFLFSYIFIILQMQDFALLGGAIALFAVLAIVMMLSRNVDWYQLSKA